MNSPIDNFEAIVSSPFFGAATFGDGILTLPRNITEEIFQMDKPTHIDPTYGYGPREAMDDTRQAQQQVANDAPVDVNPNAIVARSQMLTVDLAGKGFAAAQERRQIIADLAIGK